MRLMGSCMWKWSGARTGGFCIKRLVAGTENAERRQDAGTTLERGRERIGGVISEAKGAGA